ncbi:MAG: NAD(P)-dependent alcohol dehydrogenase [Sandaracinaceae bacterium]
MSPPEPRRDPTAPRRPSGASADAASAPMCAIVRDRYGSADVLELQEVPRPSPGPGEVLIRVHAAGLDRGAWHLMTGRPYLMRLMGFGLFAPAEAGLGLDLAGTVAAVGPDVARFQVGDEVYGEGRGAFAELAVAREDRLAPKPSRLSPGEAAAVPTSAVTALHALTREGDLQAGQRVLILGASGGVGSFAVQLAKARGAGHVTGVCSAGKMDLVRDLGADEVIDYRTDALGRTAERWDLIVDIGGNRPVGALRRLLSPDGTLVIAGGEGGGPLLGGIHRQLWASMLSPWVGHTLKAFFSEVGAEELATLGELIEEGKVRPAVDRTFPLADAADAMRYLLAGQVRGKVVISVSPDRETSSTEET